MEATANYRSPEEMSSGFKPSRPASWATLGGPCSVIARGASSRLASRSSVSLGERWSIGLGASLSTQWSFMAEDGDAGRYDFAQGAIWPTVHLRFAHLLM